MDASASTHASAAPEASLQDEIDGLLKSNTTVIVGAGSIGLWTAYYLAKARNQATPPGTDKIIVLEASETPFGETSGSCIGSIHNEFETEELAKLSKDSFSIWKQLAEDREFRDSVGWHSAGSTVKVTGDKKEKITVLPNWIRLNDGTWAVSSRYLEAEHAVIDPSRLGKWLTKACGNLGVQICTSVQAFNAELDRFKRVSAIYVRRQCDGEKARLSCNKIVLAAGAWTFSLFRELFRYSRMPVNTFVTYTDWILSRSMEFKITESAACVSLNAVVGENLKLSARGNGTIYMCGPSVYSRHPPPPGVSRQEESQDVKKLIDYAGRFLTPSHSGDIQRGRAFIETRDCCLPTMSVVAPDLLDWGNGYSDESGKQSGTVFLCCGHTDYGLTLGPASGEFMSRLVRGEEIPESDAAPFRNLYDGYQLPRHENES